MSEAFVAKAAPQFNWALMRLLAQSITRITRCPVERKFPNL